MLAMAHQESSADDLGVWNPALRPDNHIEPIAATSTEDSHSSDERKTSDLNPPLSEGYFSTWDTPNDLNAGNSQNTHIDALVIDEDSTLNTTSADTLGSTDEMATKFSKASALAPNSQGSSQPGSAASVQPVSDQPSDPPAEVSSSGFSSVDATSSTATIPPNKDNEDYAAWRLKDRESIQPEADVLKYSPGVDPVEVVLTSSGEPQDFAALLASNASSNTGTSATLFETPADEHSRLDSEATKFRAETGQVSSEQPHFSNKSTNDAQSINLEATEQTAIPESSGSEVIVVEPNAGGNAYWANGVDGDIDSDGDDFFNQLKTQTKPIFAPPEAESRFEEGVPLLDESPPVSPERGVIQNNDAVDAFGNGDESNADGFFNSVQNSDADRKPTVHITRKSTSQVMESTGFEPSSPDSDCSAAAELDDALKTASAPHVPQVKVEASDPSEEEMAARWEAELSEIGEDDLAARWEAALDDDDLLLEDDTTQATGFETQHAPHSPNQSTNNAALAELNSPFEYPQKTRPQPIFGVYTPHQPSTADLVGGVAIPAAGPSASSYFSQQPSNPVTARGESFAERSKEGYKSPYDLPDDLSRPRRPLVTHKPVPSNFNNTLSPPNTHDSSLTHNPAHSAVPPPQSTTGFPAASPPAPKNFYEELPLPPPRSRPASPGLYSPNPTATAATQPSFAPPPKNSYAPAAGVATPLPLPPVPLTDIPPQSDLRPTERSDPYSTILASSAPAGPSAASRYSPRPPGLQASTKPPSLPRYSPAPPPASTRNRYASQPLMVPGHTNSLPFQPRTSSPLAYHEKVSYQPEDVQHPQPQPPSLQPSVDLSPRRTQRHSVDRGPPSVPQLPNGSAGSPVLQQQTPSRSRCAPPEYISEFAQRVAPINDHTPACQAPKLDTSNTTEPVMSSPRRSQTQSPGQQMTSPRALVPFIETLPRPASVHGSSSPTKASNPYAPNQASPHNRAVYQQLDFIAPVDGQEYDPLERWKGAPIFKFGFGGAVVSCFPKHIPRYSVGQPTPMIMPSPGEPKFTPVNDWLPARETIVPHPGPLRTKSKKKDLLAWLSSKIAVLENEVPSKFDQSHIDAPKRYEEKILLWKITKILVENDGALEGSPEIQQSLRQVIFHNLTVSDSNVLHEDAPQASAISKPFAVPSQPDTVDPQFNVELQSSLIHGDREKAVWSAVDRRLWGHAMVMASTMDKATWSQVVQEFVRREVRSPTGNTEPLAALYAIFGGNAEESIDELVPPSARAGHHLISKAGGHGAQKDALEGLNGWRDTLGLVLSNRSSGDEKGLLALGRLLASYGRTEAAHICFVLSRTAVFGGVDDPNANIVLLGIDNQRYPSSLKDEDAILLTEAYEYATSVLGNSSAANLPYLLAFKLIHAKQLADKGLKTEAQSYCDAITASLKASTRPSPYHNQHLLTEVDELSGRLRQMASDGSSSWISKPSMERVSGSMWARFNSFVAGDESDAASTGSGRAGETADFGPFANVAGTPTVSRSPSVSDFYGSYPGIGAQPIPTGGSSRYLPSNQYAPHASPEQLRGRSSMDSQRSISGSAPFGQRRSSHEQPSPVESHMFQGAPMYGSPGLHGYQATPPQSSYIPLAPVKEDSPQSASEVDQPAPSAVNGLFYQPPGRDPTSASQSPYYQGPPGMPQSGDSGYMPPDPSNAYEPPSYAPDVSLAPDETETSEDNQQPKKRQFMDDDDDDDLASRAAAIQKAQKAENDRKADEAFKKAAEEDARKAAQQPKKGWFGGWFGGGKKEADNAGGGPIKAKLGEENSFYYDKDLKKWVNKKDPNSAATARATPPPPRSSAPPSRAASSGSMPPPPAPPIPTVSGSRPPSSSSDVPPPISPSPALSALGVPPPLGNLPRSVSTSATMSTPPGGSGGPPRPSSSLTHASSIDDLLGAPQARKGNTVRGKKKGRYVDVMAK